MTPPQNDSNPVITNITGKRVALGPIRRELVPLYQKWINDFEVSRCLAMYPRPWTLEAELAWWDEASKLGDHVHFTIYERSELIPIGTTGLRFINHANRTAEFGIVIGEKSMWNKGLGTEATALMLDYGFTAVGLHNILLRVFDSNRWAIQAYKKAGFKEIGRRRECVRVGGRVCDEILMDCLASEFDGGVVKKMLLHR